MAALPLDTAPVLTLPILLASASPRRAQLLAGMDVSFRVRATDVEELFPDDLPVEQVAGYLARLKAYAALPLAKEGELVLAADTVVILNGLIYGKPTDDADARRILSELSGNTHTVITGVCLLQEGKEAVFSDRAEVTLRQMSDAEIKYYVAKYQPFDKAGAYAIQEWIGLTQIVKMEGTYANIMGLPTQLVYEHLQHFTEQ